MFRKNIVFLTVILASASLQAEAKHYATRCGLVRDLRNHGFPAKEMQNWVCLIEAESLRRTDIVSKVNQNGSRDYGLFQINDKYWCSNTATPGKDCNVKCRDLLTDDITKACSCARKVFKRHGFKAWYGWRNRCQGALPDISSC